MQAVKLTSLGQPERPCLTQSIQRIWSRALVKFLLALGVRVSAEGTDSLEMFI